MKRARVRLNGLIVKHVHSTVFFFPEKTKNLLFNGAKAVMGKLWTGEEGSTEQHPTEQAETPAGHALLKGQTLIGHDGRLMRTSKAPGQIQVTNYHMAVCV